MKNNLRTALNNIKNNGYYVLKNQFSKNICKKLLILTKEIHSSKKNQFKDKYLRSVSNKHLEGDIENPEIIEEY